MTQIQENIEQILSRIRAACLRAGRSPEEVGLIAVSKTKPAEALAEAYEIGQRDFGENKVQEITAKREVLPDDINWHMIGHLQRNKVKYIARDVSLIHSVDSLRLAETIEQEAKKWDRVIPVLIEVNVAGEESKFGVTPGDCLPLIEQISALEHVSVRGLMTIAPFVADAEENRHVFRQLRELSVDIQAKNMNNVSMCVLSMGMTGDFEVAVEEGATLVRVGTAIFGARNI